MFDKSNVPRLILDPIRNFVVDLLNITLDLHYSICSTIEIIKKLTQQYVESFKII